jgi:hypothetical protein
VEQPGSWASSQESQAQSVHKQTSEPQPQVRSSKNKATNEKKKCGQVRALKKPCPVGRI